MIFSIVLPISDHFNIENTYEELNSTLKNIFSVSQSENIVLEVLIVNWNVIPELKTVDKIDRLDKPIGVTIRYIEIDSELHNRFNLSHKIPFYVAHAVNTAIRRAKSDVIVKMLRGTVLLEDTWKKMIHYIMEKKYQTHLLTIASHSELDPAVLQKYPDIYAVSEVDIADFCLKKLENSRVIDYRLKRIYQNREASFRKFDVQIFSKEQAVGVRGYPELSIYPTDMMEKFFLVNTLKNGYEPVVWFEAQKIYYKSHNSYNPADDSELKLAPDTEKIVIARINQEEAPVLFNDDNWGLNDIELPIRILE